jgi:mono/diheme cytochrome c family protein
MKILSVIIALLLLIVAASVGFVQSGVYNVSAIEGHGPFEDWLLSTTMKSSVRRHAEGIAVPNLTDPNLIQLGFDHYDEMCVGCHGAPGVRPAEFAKGLTPQPPELTEDADEWTAAELYWITKNGIKMTGMPAWGPTHGDEELWAIVAFLRELPGLSPQDYQRMKARAERGQLNDSGGQEHDHAYGDESAHAH